MKLASWNVNGIRAVQRKGELEAFLRDHDPDVLFLQEVKAHPDKLDEQLTAHSEYFQFYNPAQKAGYAGTGVWVKRSFAKAPEMSRSMDGFEDDEGRIVRADINVWTLIGVYFPNGGKSEEAWHGKLAFYEQFLAHIDALRRQGRRVVWCGDVN